MNEKIKSIHFVGIGGIGMSGLAEIMNQQGYTVTGSDNQLSEITDHLASAGVKIYKGHDAKNVQCDLLVYTSAVNDSNPELAEAKRRGIPTMKRAELLGEFTRNKKAICISGTHGKTTTTAMTGLMLEQAGKDPTMFVGGILQGMKTNAKLGRSEWIVVEADEFDRSFLTLFSHIAVINNVEEDHLDCYKDLNDIQQTFAQFANQTSDTGKVIVNADDPRVAEIIPIIRKQIKTFGFVDHADVRAERIRQEKTTLTFSVLYEQKNYGEVRLNLSGDHNVKNALAATAVGLEIGLSFDVIRQSLENFQGTGRRFELLGTVKGVTFIDDYAHHPTEIKATLNGARKGWEKNRIVAVFQPHLFSRTRDLMNEFATAFGDADMVLLTNIYAAREKPIPGIDGTVLYRAIQQHHPNAFYVPDKNMLDAEIEKMMQDGDVVITMGAGDITEIGRRLVRKLI